MEKTVGEDEYYNHLVSDADIANLVDKEVGRSEGWSEVGRPVGWSVGRKEGERLTQSPPRKGMPFYPWTVWEDGKYHVIKQGVDFAVSRPRMQTMLHNRARNQGHVVTTETLQGGGIGFRFFDSREAMAETMAKETAAAEMRYAHIKNPETE